MNTRILFALTAILLVLSGCDSDPVVEWEYLRGEIIETAVGEEREACVAINGVALSGQDLCLGDQEVSAGPVVVRAGVPFDVTVYTFTDPCYEAQPSEVTREGMTTTIAVQDRKMVGWCHAVRTFTPRTDQVMFTTLGETEIVVRGVKRDHDLGAYVDRELRYAVVVTE